MQHKLNRRDFIKTSGAIAVGTVLPTVLKAQETKAIDIAVVKGSPDSNVKQAFKALGGIQKFVKLNATILLKPNVSFPNPVNFGSTTNPEVVKAVAKACVEAGAKRIIVIDHTMRDSDQCFKRTGLNAALQGLDGVKLLSIENENLYTEVSVPEGEAIKTVKIIKLLERCDLLINMPCAKSHVATDVSFGLKNLMGLIWDRNFFHNSTDLHTAIAELAKVIVPQLTFLDAQKALVTNGPTGPGKVQQLDTLIAGIDPLAVDTYALSMANWNNRSHSVSSVKHLAYAAKLGIGESNLEKLTIEHIES